ncbi:MAG: polysaccharide deacetylase family protein, partial [Verrucomicrobiota bacterium]
MKRAASRSWIRPAIRVFAVLAPIWTIFWFRNDWVVALTPLFVSHVLLLYPTLAPQSQWWGPVIRAFDTPRREVWITIDDGPTPEHTTKILDILERQGARATFFVIGSRAKNTPHLIEEILRRGHAVANHTFTHPSRSFWCARPKRIADEIDRCAEVIRRDSDQTRLFRAPAGLKNPFVHPVLARRGMRLVGWTIRGLDTWRRDPSAVAATINRKARPGAIILLHEGHHLEKSPDLNPRCLELTLQ